MAKNTRMASLAGNSSSCPSQSRLSFFHIRQDSDKYYPTPARHPQDLRPQARNESPAHKKARHHVQAPLHHESTRIGSSPPRPADLVPPVPKARPWTLQAGPRFATRWRRQLRNVSSSAFSRKRCIRGRSSAPIWSTPALSAACHTVSCAGTFQKRSLRFLPCTSLTSCRRCACCSGEIGPWPCQCMNDDQFSAYHCQRLSPGGSFSSSSLLSRGFAHGVFFHEFYFRFNVAG